MKICQVCGKEIDEAAAVCPYCGVAQAETVQPETVNVEFEQQANAQPTAQPYAGQQGAGGQQYGAAGQQYGAAPVDNGGFGWGLLGFCIPLVGLILYLVWKDEKPKTSKAAGMGALISVCISVAMWILTAILGVLGAALS